MRVNLIINIPSQSTILNYEIRDEGEEEEERRDVISSVPRNKWISLHAIIHARWNKFEKRATSTFPFSFSFISKWPCDLI